MAFKKDLRTRIQENVDSQGGVQNAIKFASNWVKENLESIESNKVSRLSGLLHQGKIHFFDYNPKLKDKLSFYDRKPMVLSLGLKENSDLEIGVNLHFAPIRIRWRFLNGIESIFKTRIEQAMSFGRESNALQESSVPIKYESINPILRSSGLSFAIRTYIPTRRSNTHVVSFDSWDIVAMANEFRFIGENASNIYRSFSKNKP